MALTEYFTSIYTLQLKRNEHLQSFQDRIRSLQKNNPTHFIESQATGNQLDIRDFIKKS